MSLSYQFIRSLKPEAKPKKHSDGGGLYLFVQPNGSKLWRMNYRHGGKQKTLSLGAWPDVTLNDARALRARAKEALAEGRDPGADGKKAMNTVSGDTFQEVAMEWLAAQDVAWTPKHSLRIGNRLREDVFPMIGSKPVSTVTAPDILQILRKVEDRGALDIAKRIRQTVGAVLRYAISTGRCGRDPAADLRGALKPSPRVKHLAALRAGELPEFFERLAR